MTVIESSNFTSADAHRSLLERLAEFRRLVRGRLLLEGLARLVAIAVGLALITFVLDRTFRLSHPARTAMLLAVIVTLIVVSFRHLLSPLRLKLDPLTLGAALDRAGPRDDGAMTACIGTVLELPGLLARPAAPSAAMVERAVIHCHTTLSAVDFRTRLDDRRRNIAYAVIGGALLLSAVSALAAPGVFRLWAARVILGSDEPWPQKTYLQVAGADGGAIVVPRGEPFVLRVSAKAGSVVPEVVSVRFREGDGSRITANLTSFGPNDFRYDFPSIASTVEAEISGGDDRLGPIMLRPADRPKIVDLKLVTQHPTEPAPQEHTFGGGDADLSFLPRTRMQLFFTANTPIAEARVKSSKSQPAAADCKTLDDRHFSVAWEQAAAVQLQIELVSRDAQLTSVPTVLAIGLKTDQPPRVTMGFIGVRQRVTARAKIPLTVDARDDYGLASVGLALKAESPDPANPTQLKAENSAVSLFGPANPATQLQVQPAKTLELEPMKLPVGSLLTVNAAATDACYVGAQTSQSRQVTFRVVPPEELFREILLRQQSERAKFRKQTDEATAVREQLTTLSSNDAALQVARRHRTVQREVTRITASLSETLVEMRLNVLATDEAYELMEKTVLAPLKLLNDELLNPQKDALDALKAADSKALADAQARQDRVVERMQQIMKQMSQWDSFVDVLNQLNEIIKLQDQAQQGTTQLKKKETDGIFEK